MPKVVAQTINRQTRKTAAAVKTGRQRAASHSSGGNNRATGITVAKRFDGRNIANALISVSAAAATTPSMNSLREGLSRTTEVNSITNGATAMIPSASDSIQCCQVVNIDVEL